MLKTLTFSLAAASIFAIGLSAQPAPAAAGGPVDAYGQKWHGYKSRHWHKKKYAYKHKRKYWQKRRVKYPYKRYVQKVHYPQGCYYRPKYLRVRSLGPYGWYTKTISRPVHVCW